MAANGYGIDNVSAPHGYMRDSTLTASRGTSRRGERALTSDCDRRVWGGCPFRGLRQRTRHDKMTHRREHRATLMPAFVLERGRLSDHEESGHGCTVVLRSATTDGSTSVQGSIERVGVDCTIGVSHREQDGWYRDILLLSTKYVPMNMKFSGMRLYCWLVSAGLRIFWHENLPESTSPD